MRRTTPRPEGGDGVLARLPGRAVDRVFALLSHPDRTRLSATSKFARSFGVAGEPPSDACSIMQVVRDLYHRATTQDRTYSGVRLPACNGRITVSFFPGVVHFARGGEHLKIVSRENLVRMVYHAEFVDSSRSMSNKCMVLVFMTILAFHLDIEGLDLGDEGASGILHKGREAFPCPEFMATVRDTIFRLASAYGAEEEEEEKDGVQQQEER